MFRKMSVGFSLLKLRNINKTSHVWAVLVRQVSHANNKDENVRDKILAASLKYVNQYGWSKETLAAGARDVGYPGITHGLFSRGGADLVHYFQKSSNMKLVEIMKHKDDTNNALPPAEFVENAIKQRLQMIMPYINKWPQAIAIMSLPPNVPNALATILTMADDICYYAGDRSVDFNWYARRIGIAAIYKAAELYMIQDSSQENEQTWKFLNRRLGEAIQVNQLLMKSDLASQGAKDTVMSAFITARNILGLNWNR